jgi:hypothetical protein
MRNRRESEAGTGRVGCAIWLVILLAVIVVCFKIVPVKMRTSSFYDSMQEQAQFGSIKSDEAIKNELGKRAGELQLPLTKDQINVHRDGSNVYVEVHYQISVDIFGYTYQWREDRIISRPLFAT